MSEVMPRLVKSMVKISMDIEEKDSYLYVQGSDTELSNIMVHGKTFDEVMGKFITALILHYESKMKLSQIEPQLQQGMEKAFVLNTPKKIMEIIGNE